MKLKLKYLVTTGALLAASTSALADMTQAQVNTAQSTASLSTAPQGLGSFSSLLFVAYNTDGSFSQVQSLGTLGGAPASTTAFGTQNTDLAGLSLSWNLSNSLLSGNASSLQWGIYAYDTQGDPSLAAGQYRFITTVSNDSDAAALASPITNTIISAGNYAQGFLAQNSLAAASVVSTTAGATENWTSDGGLGTFAQVATTGSATSTLAMYVFSNAIGDNGTATTALAYAGTWALNAALGTLTYAVGTGSQVPLPAAAWLLLSGLGGLGIVGRRRAISAVAA